MDALGAILDGPRARDAFVLRCVLDSPWSLEIADEAPLTIVALVRGAAWLMPSAGQPEVLRPGDLALMRGPDHYTMADSLDTPIQVVIHPGQICTTVGGEDLRTSMELGVRTWGNAKAGGDAVFVTGTYVMESEISDRLIGVLPPMAVIRSESFDSPLTGILQEELSKRDPGQAAILDRLLDLLLMAAVRSWMTRPDGAAPDWYAAQSDPVVGPAIRLIHDTSARPWTVASLAYEVGMSRAGFARRFSETVGMSPIRYLTEWRLALAADLLREEADTVGHIASQVGYGSPYALSIAFKRQYGVSPTAYRARARSSASVGL